MVPWMDGIRAYPGFSDWKRKAIAHIIDYGERTGIEQKKPCQEEFKFPLDIERQHAAMMSYLSLSVTHNAMAATEFYFRRYPFQSLPVTSDVTPAFHPAATRDRPVLSRMSAGEATGGVNPARCCSSSAANA
ncbi:hypothetical protein, partial [Sphingomonas turrisvirgatae]|uniref:hypothetical protein n=1 Tax=Sphingomonas turrisvirgatae TaxID=1888892 RepID=UPI0019D3BF2B